MAPGRQDLNKSATTGPAEIAELFQGNIRGKTSIQGEVPTFPILLQLPVPVSIARSPAPPLLAGHAP